MEASLSKADCTRRTWRAAARSVRDRWPSTPAQRSEPSARRSQSGGARGRRRPGGPGDGAASASTRRRWARAASRKLTRCWRTYSARPSRTHGLRGRRIPLPRRASEAIGKSFAYVPVPMAVARAFFAPKPVQRFFGMPVQALDYFDDPVRHDTTQASADLGELGIECPRLAGYVPRLVEFYRAHRETVRREAMI